MAMMKLYLRLITLCILLTTVFSCTKQSPADGIVKLIDETENNLYETSSIEEMGQMQFDLLDNITGYLDREQNGYRFSEGTEDYQQVMSRFDRYNVIYCRAMSRFNPELSTERGDQNKVVRTIALMKNMESKALVNPNGFNP